MSALSLTKGDVIDMPAEELWARMETEFRGEKNRTDHVYAAVAVSSSVVLATCAAAGYRGLFGVDQLTVESELCFMPSRDDSGVLSWEVMGRGATKTRAVDVVYMVSLTAYQTARFSTQRASR